ncbi:MAG TPA: amidohydrolase family protein [Fimbriimonas sp.]
MTELQRFIDESPLADTHEHQRKEDKYLNDPFDVLQDLFDNYILAELNVAGATKEATERLLNPNDPDIGGRFEAVREAWERCKHTGYGEGVRLIARHVYGLEELTPEALEACDAPRRQGDRLRILRGCARLDHIQVDLATYKVEPDPTGPDFFLYDLSWLQFAEGKIDYEALTEDVGVEVRGLDDLDSVMEAVFERFAAYSIAVKTQHAYVRTLRWEDREQGDVEQALASMRAGSEDKGQQLALGDWCLSRGAALCAKHDLPMKIHTGYMAGQGYMDPTWIRSGHLHGLIRKHPGTRFVLMHTAYPYTDELVALAKHYPNVYLDLCWAWSMDPFSTAEFVRKTIHAVPSHKLFGFGGDSWWPNAAYAYSIQARKGLAKALQAEVDDGELTEKEAASLAKRFMMTNQEECFRTSEKKRVLCAAPAGPHG